MLELRGVTKRLGAFQLADLDLCVSEGEHFVLMGPSGVGKTVLLEIICGLLEPDRGRVCWRGQDITRVPPEARRFSVAYQDYALFPHMTAYDNIAYGLRARREQEAAVRREVRALAQTMGIGDLLGRKPDTLSGGEQQRVALARALVTRPRLLLLDEPLSALDGGARRRLRKELRRIHQQFGTTMLHVTHDVAEASALADRVAVMLHQRIRQVGRPEEALEQPADPEVAAFLGLAPNEDAPDGPAVDDPHQRR